MLNCAGEETLSLCSRPALASDHYAGSDSAQSLEADWTRLHQELFSRGDPLAVSETLDEHHTPLLKCVLVEHHYVYIFVVLKKGGMVLMSMVLVTAKHMRSSRTYWSHSLQHNFFFYLATNMRRWLDAVYAHVGQCSLSCWKLTATCGYVLLAA